MAFLLRFLACREERSHPIRLIQNPLVFENVADVPWDPSLSTFRRGPGILESADTVSLPNHHHGLLVWIR